MFTTTVLFRKFDQHVAVVVGGIDPMTGEPTWHEVSPITGVHTFYEWEELVRPAVVRFAKTLGVDPATLRGGRLAYSGEIHSMMEFDFDSPTDEDDDETLGPCGCTDYHMADCPTRTDAWFPGDRGSDPYDDQPED